MESTVNRTPAPVGNGVDRPVVEPPVMGGPEHTDYYHLKELLTDEQRALKSRVRAFMDSEVAPVINGYWERAEFPHDLVPKLAQLNLAGFSIRGYGCPGLDSLTTGLAVMELARGDLSGEFRKCRARYQAAEASVAASGWSRGSRRRRSRSWRVKHQAKSLPRAE